ncbi:MAG: DUF1254 domain-containing protein [Simkaniaceae bacterium]|nr:DUF1254 domain-containing protein [Simkaniaceae bacterium]
MIKRLFLLCFMTVHLGGQTAEEKWNYTLALQAATWGAPLVMMYTLRYHDVLSADAKNSPNSLLRIPQVIDPQSTRRILYPSPNVNVIYGFGFMDLRQEPVVVEVPDSNGLYYMVEIVDMWGNSFAYIGGKKTGYKGGKFLLVSPSWEGTVPEGMNRITCATPWVFLQPRVHAYIHQTLNESKAFDVLQNIQVMGLSSFLGSDPLPTPEYNYPAPVRIDPSLSVSALNFKNPMQFWDILMRAMVENPPPQDQIDALLPMFAPLGLQFGSLWSEEGLSREVLEAMKQAVLNIGGILDHLPIGTDRQGVNISPASMGNFGTNYEDRAVVMRNGLTANTPQEAIYWVWFRDSQEGTFNGSSRYTITFAKEPAFISPGFWSLTMYNNDTSYLVPNVISRYMIGSDTKGLKKNRDGSLTIYVQPTSPGKEKESNWLPSVEGGFYIIGRVYAPAPEVVEIITKQEVERLPPLILQK